MCVCLPFIFIADQTLFIQPIDFSFQNFSNLTKKNNQLDTPAQTQYFSATSQGTRGAEEDQVAMACPR
jgi:hypothetical protein